MPTATVPLGTESFNFDASSADDDDCCPATSASLTGATFLPLVSEGAICFFEVGK